jgi:hypothetical protein
MVQTEENLRNKGKVATGERIAWFVINKQSQPDGGKQIGVQSGVTHEHTSVGWTTANTGEP